MREEHSPTVSPDHGCHSINSRQTCSRSLITHLTRKSPETGIQRTQDYRPWQEWFPPTLTVQSHRTLLGQSQEPLDRDTAGQCRDGIELGIDDDMERPLPCRSTAGEFLRERSPSRQETISKSQPTSHARRDSSQILCSHLTQMRFRVKYFARVALVTQQHDDP